MILYHATFRSKLRRIKDEGLQPNKKKSWDISETGPVYLCEDAEMAFSFCECAEDVPDSVYESGIVVFAVNTSNLNHASLKIDQNIKDQSNGSRCFTYSKAIPPLYLMVVNRNKGLVGWLNNLKRVPGYES